MKKTFLKISSFVLVLTALFSGSATWAATPAESDLDPSFLINTPVGADGSIMEIEVQSDKKIIALGTFKKYNGTTVNGIMRLNTDLSVDTSFNMGNGFNTISWPATLAIQSDGKILVGGPFSSYQGVTANKLIRLNSDGSRDDSFTIASSLTINSVGNIAIQSNGKIVLGGSFSYGGSNKTFVRLNTDGSIDSSFTMSSTPTEFAIAIDANDKIIVPGGYGRTLVRLNADGTTDSSFNIGAGFNGSVRAVLPQADGKILVGGGFLTYQGVAASKIIRLNADGSRDSTFDIGAGISDGTDVAVAAMTFDQNGKILVTGYFKYYKGVSANSLMRLNTDGSRDTSFNVGTAFGSNYGPYINNVKIGNNNQIILAGSFSSYQGVTSPTGMIVINSDGSRDNTKKNIANGFDLRQGNNTLYTIATQSDGKILVGGWFTMYNQVSSPGIIRLNTDGSRDTTFDIGSGFNIGIFDSSLNGRFVYKIVVQPDEKILVIGSFTTYKGVTANKIIRLNTDGSIDSTFNAGAGFNNDYYSSPRNLLLQADGKILVNGSFTTYKGVAVSKWIRLNSDGSIDNTFTNIGTSLNCGAQESCKIGPDGKMYGLSGYNVIRLNANGSLDTSWNIGAGFQYDASIFEIQPDGKVLVGGNIYSYQGVSIKGLARLNTDGSRDTSFTAANVFDRNNAQQVEGLLVQTDGKIIAWGAGKFVRFNSNGTMDTSFVTESAGGQSSNIFNGVVKSVVVGPEGNIFIAGSFTSYKGIPATYFISLYGNKQPEGSLPVFLSDTQIITYLLKTKKTVDPKWLFMGTIPLYF